MTSLDHIDWNKIVSFLQQNANSDLAREELSEIAPLSSPEEAYQAFSELDQAFELLKFDGTRPRLD